MKCEHTDCMTCPYKDCISDDGPLIREKKKPGRKKMNPEEVKKRKLAWQREYYRQHKDKYKEYYKQYYQDKKEHCKAVQKAYRERKKKESS